jgi:hypothetical protein
MRVLHIGDLNQTLHGSQFAVDSTLNPNVATEPRRDGSHRAQGDVRPLASRFTFRLVARNQLWRMELG